MRQVIAQQKPYLSPLLFSPAEFVFCIPFLVIKLKKQARANNHNIICNSYETALATSRLAQTPIETLSIAFKAIIGLNIICSYIHKRVLVTYPSSRG